MASAQSLTGDGVVQPFDLRTDPHDDVLGTVENWLAVRLERGTAVYGNSGATVGFRTDGRKWVRIEWRRASSIREQSWTGVECASVIRGVAMPRLWRSVRWRDDVRGMVWRAEELDLIESGAISSTGVIATDPQLSEMWWRQLSKSLTALGLHETTRVGMTQDHLSRRIAQVFGNEIDTTVSEWSTAHTDLHWGNLTAPDFSILDWENWGLAPRGLDAAILWVHSLAVPELATRISNKFGSELSTRSGRLAQLLLVANIIRLAARRTNPSPLLEPARRAADVILNELRQN